MSSETVEERLTRLEEELSRVRRRSRRLLACVSLAVVVGAVAWVLAGSASTAQAAGEAQKVIRANEFILEDAQGRTRAMLYVSKNGAGLSLWDENDKIRATLNVTKDGPSLGMYDENDKPRVWLDVDKGGPGLRLLAENGKDRAMLRVVKDGPSLDMYDEKGQPCAGLSVTKDRPGLSLLDENGKMLWHAP